MRKPGNGGQETRNRLAAPAPMARLHVAAHGVTGRLLPGGNEVQEYQAGPSAARKDKRFSL